MILENTKQGIDQDIYLFEKVAKEYNKVITIVKVRLN